ncbi:uncharacterized protein LOC134194016 [Corticium candelabrum]|uniref:uncharacterized protein LOC134194016 n=1 Tax=Corticium candelabrum TaxID=121492 RepID=UPI002E2677F8|nr:uncharacterized protein LOC134194016 [Corticium candelabrum]
MAFRRKRKFHGNQHTTPKKPAMEMSRSEAKLRDVSYDVGPSSSGSASSKLEGYRFIDMDVLAAFLGASLVCARCHGQVSLSEAEDERMGLASKLVLTCQRCQHEENTFTSKKIQRGALDVNRRVVLAMRMIGCGLEPLQRFCGYMNMPGSMGEHPFQNHVTALRNAAKEEAVESMKKAVDDIRHFHEENVDGTISIGVSGDGTWRKRGYSSFHGVGTVISIVSGKLVDLSVKSSYCRACAVCKKKEGTEEYKEWLTKHSPDCHKNYSGSSGGMEVSSMIDIFQRSVATRNAKYTEYLGDGDSKTIKGINDAAPYGPDLLVEKLECINHVSKRLYHRLEKVKADNKGKKLSDGKGIDEKGRLSLKVMKELQMYFGKAIKDNQADLEAMKKAIWATYYHRSSTDEKPQHHFCPDGEDTWCKYNKDASTYTHHDVIPHPISDLIKPAYEELTKDELLKKCLHGGTSNANEGFNNLLWRIAPKSEFSGLPTLELSSYLAVLKFNDGESSVARVLARGGGGEIGKFSMVTARKKDERRVKASKYKEREEVKRKRLQLRKDRSSKMKKQVTKEGPEYGAGMF